MTRMSRPKKRFRLPFVRHPRDASHDYDDASYDGGGASGGAYLRHIVIAAVVLALLAALLRWAF